MYIAFYGRVSSEEQAERGNIQNQVEFARKYFELHGPQYGIKGYVTYLDEGVSGTLPLTERPAGARMLLDAKAKKFAMVFVYRLDRLARSTKYVLETYEFLEDLGIGLKSMTEHFDTTTGTGKFFMTLLASIAALERDTILERTMLGKEQKARAGKWVSGLPPFGYKVGLDGKLQIHEDEAKIVQLIFTLYLGGLTTVPVAEHLNAKGVPTPARFKKNKEKATYKWSAGHISIILNNSAYTGKYTWMKRAKKEREKITVDIPAIIDESIFLRAKALLAGNADAARGLKGRSYILRGLIFCANCGRAMVGSSGHSKKERVYYRCQGTANQGAGKQCRAKLVRAVDIEEAVWGDLVAFIQDPGSLYGLVKGCTDMAKGNLPVAEKEAKAQKQVPEKEKTKVPEAEFFLSQLQEKIAELERNEMAELIRGLVKRIDIYTEFGAEGKKTLRAEIQYRFWPPGDEALYGSSYSGDAKNHTMNCA